MTETRAENGGAVEEDRARAACYAVIGRLFFGPPDPNLLAEICGAAADAQRPAGAVSETWARLQDACRSAFPAVLRQEYDTLFTGVGKALVTPYTSRYANELAPDQHLVRLRERLDAWGLARRDRVFETEDHVSGVCDVMRYLIEEGAPYDEQQDFFREFVRPGVVPLLDAVEAVEAASFYRQVARFTRAFLDLEHDAFDMPA